MTLGQKIKELREKRGLSVDSFTKELYKATGVEITAPGMRNIEEDINKNLPLAENLKAISEYFGVTVDYLLSEVRCK